MTGRELREIRNQLGLTQAGLARLVRNDARRIRRYETGKLEIPRYTALLVEILRDEGPDFLERYAA